MKSSTRCDRKDRTTPWNICSSSTHNTKRKVSTNSWSLTKYPLNALLAAEKVTGVWSSHENGLNNPHQPPLWTQKENNHVEKHWMEATLLLLRVDSLKRSVRTGQRTAKSRRSSKAEGKTPGTSRAPITELGIATAVTARRFPYFSARRSKQAGFGVSPFPALQMLLCWLFQFFLECAPTS